MLENRISWMRLSIVVVLISVTFVGCNELYAGPFVSKLWSESDSYIVQREKSVTFFFALKLRDAVDMKAELLSVSDPESIKYGSYLSIENIKYRYGPNEEELKRALDFFGTIKDVILEPNLHGDMVRVTASVGSVETALSTKLAMYEHKSTSAVHVLRAARPLEIPQPVREVLAFVSLNSPITGFRSMVQAQAQARRSSRRSSGGSSPAASSPSDEAKVTFRGTTPSALRKLYDIPDDQSPKLGSQSVAQFYTECFSQSDLKKFQGAAGLNTSFTVPPSHWFGDRPNDEGRPSGEASLDVQYITGVGQGVPTYYYSIKELNPYSSQNEGFLTYVWTVGNQTHPPLVHSLSYGDNEAEVFDRSKPGAFEYGHRVDLEFVKMGLRGLSILFASGDWGIGNFDGGCDKAAPDWPGSSPYVTTVGGTQPGGGVAEIVCSSRTGGVITSGGGFSDVSSRLEAPWQKSVVEAYLAIDGAVPPPSHFNAQGRGYPDVAALSYDYPVYIGGWVEALYGTSASTPAFAGMVGLMNHMRLARGLPPLGFLNPFLYWAYAQDPTAFNDITVGDNACGTSGQCCPEKFSATAGWDAATGLGSPVFSKLAALAVSFGSRQPSAQPTLGPSVAPAAAPTRSPTAQALRATAGPSPVPHAVPTPRPTNTNTDPTRTPFNKYDKSRSWLTKVLGGGG